MDAALFLVLESEARVAGNALPPQPRDSGRIPENVPPSEVSWGEHCRLAQHELPPWIADLLPEKVRAEGRAYSVSGDCLDLLELEVNQREVDWGGYSLEGLLDTAMRGSAFWAVAFVWQCDRIDVVCGVSRERALALLRENLRWQGTRRGLLLHSQL